MRDTFFDFIKRDFTLGIVLSALVFVAALAWGPPFLATNQSATAPAQASPQTATFTGTVMRDGGNVYLSDQWGNLYQLENVHHARRFEGKFVTVTGEVNSQSRLIHVETIADETT